MIPLLIIKIKKDRKCTDVCLSRKRWVSIDTGNGLVPYGTKPLPESMLTKVIDHYSVTKGQ